MGSFFVRGRTIHIKFKDENDQWRRRSTGCQVGEERKAELVLTEVEAGVAAAKEGGYSVTGPVTVRSYARQWIEDRKKLGLSDADNDWKRLKHHVLPQIGDLLVEDVRPRHVMQVISKLRTTTDLAPHTIHNIYGATRGMFQSAVLAELIAVSPCVLTKYQLGICEDKDLEWRPTAVFSRSELELLISDERIPMDRRVMYALKGIAGLRLGEAAGLRWRHYEPEERPLGRLNIVTSYDTGRTKTGKPRYMPVHPTLAALLAEWKLEGWEGMYGWKPGPDDVVAPLPVGRKVPTPRMRQKNQSYSRWVKDLETLGLRHRRLHDLRRTMISLSRTDGARGSLLKVCTHGPSKADIIDAYTTFPWKTLCGEVAKLRVQRTTRAELVSLPMVANCPESEMFPARSEANSGPGRGTPHGTPHQKPPVFPHGSPQKNPGVAPGGFGIFGGVCKVGCLVGLCHRSPSPGG